uniref:Heat-inducible transcription repressor HrcA n=2 Tax=Lygus hesperus TaxID=30085 RepID=A0A0A9YNM1_LYGHE
MDDGPSGAPLLNLFNPLIDPFKQALEGFAEGFKESAANSTVGVEQGGGDVQSSEQLVMPNGVPIIDNHVGSEEVLFSQNVALHPEQIPSEGRTQRILAQQAADLLGDLNQLTVQEISPNMDPISLCT